MSSEDDNANSPLGDDSRKKRRVTRACDMCRRKKIKCDGPEMANNNCTNCSTQNLDCTYNEAAKKRGPPKGYVESLENRLEKMETLLQRLCPDADFTKELGARLDREAWYAERARGERVFLGRPTNGSSREASSSYGGIPSTHTAPQDDLGDSDDEYAGYSLTQNFERLSVATFDRRFHGKSSGALLIRAAQDLKREYSQSVPPSQDPAQHNWVPDTRREEFWALHPWESATPNQTKAGDFDFPPDDLIVSLVEIYFARSNMNLPLLHRPTFEEEYRSRLHHESTSFAAVLLLVCAIGSRWSEDPRVLLDGETSHFSAGWKWFQQVEVARKSMLAPPNLHDLQMFSLSSLFLQGSSAPQAGWTMVGVGIRAAQDVGAHRRKVYQNKPSVQDELWKRAFWVLVAQDRLQSTSMGRPCAIQDEDFDLDYPLEVDDEYWTNDDPNLAFKQPSGKPSKMAYFISLLHLSQIQAFALRTIYSINKSKILLGFVGSQWEQHIVAELDSALNRWVDSVPDHLRWDPNREDNLFFEQSAALYASYYHLQILIHRPFIPSPKKPSPLKFPSLAICTNAARSASHVIDVLRRRSDNPPPAIIVAAFTAGIVLLLNIWGLKKSGATTDPSKHLSDVHKCMELLKEVETRWHSAGRLWDIIAELATVGEFPLPAQSNMTKRPRDSNDAFSYQQQQAGNENPSGANVHRPVAPMPRTWQQQSTSSLPPPIPAATAPQPPHPTPYHSGPYTNSSMMYTPANSLPQPQEQQYYGQPGSIFQPYAPPPAEQTMPMSYPQHYQPPYPGLPNSGSYPPGQGENAVHDPGLIDSTLTVWDNAPRNFEMEDWDVYSSHMSGAAYGRGSGHGGQ